MIEIEVGLQVEIIDIMKEKEKYLILLEETKIPLEVKVEVGVKIKVGTEMLRRIGIRIEIEEVDIKTTIEI